MENLRLYNTSNVAQTLVSAAPRLVSAFLLGEN